MSEVYDCIVVGGGVTGSALFYTLANYTNLNKIALIEKCSKLAQINSHCDNSSQTLHFGDIESNYNYQSAKENSKKAELVAGFIEKHGTKDQNYYKKHKLLLGVGSEESEKVKNRYFEIKDLFPKLQLLNKEQIKEIEPKIVEGRDENIELVAISSPDGYAVDFGELSELFVKVAKQKSKDKTLDVNLNSKVKKITYNKENNLYEIEFHNKKQKTILQSKTLVVCAGAHSLMLAQSLGLSKHLAILPVSGSFFSSKRKVLNGKVYTLQIKKLPFAAIHGDPYVKDQNDTRFGPTTRVFPILEKDNYKTILEFFQSSTFTIPGFLTLFKIISDPVLFKFTAKHSVYDIPIIGKYFFIKGVRKIIPTITVKDIDYRKGIGGIRPQVINTKTKELERGLGKIYGYNAIFNITPSPGATACLDIARNDALKLKEYFGDTYHFDLDRFLKNNS